MIQMQSVFNDGGGAPYTRMMYVFNTGDGPIKNIEVSLPAGFRVNLTNCSDFLMGQSLCNVFITYEGLEATPPLQIFSAAAVDLLGNSLSSSAVSNTP